MTTFVKLYVQGESSKMPVVYDRFGTNGLKTVFSMLGLFPVFSRRQIISRVEKALGFPVKFSRCIPEDLKG